MRFSVIVPCFDQAHYLFGLLDNIAHATTREHEVIIINDGSTKPRARQMIDRLRPAADHQKLVRIHQENKGLASTRNVGIEAASGDFIQFLDADDMLVPGKLDRQEKMLSAEELDIVIDEYMLVDDDLCDFRRSEDIVGAYDPTTEEIARKWERGMSIPIHCPLIRRVTLGSTRFAENMRAKEDWLFWMLYFSEPRKHAFTGVVGAIYRVHNASMTRADRAGSGYQWLLAVEQASCRLPETFDEISKAMAVDHFNKFYLRFFYQAQPDFQKMLFRNFLKSSINAEEAE